MSHDNENEADGRWLIWVQSFALLVVLGGLTLRLIPVLSADFPLNDGGLFAVMTEAVRTARYGLPEFVYYNGFEIPFAYPPLGFYLAAAIADVARVDAITVLRWLPLALNMTATAAFGYLAWTALRTWPAVLAASVVMVILPSSYQWQIGGGGLTRALGWVFALLALREAYLVVTAEAKRAAIRLGVFGGLTLLSHLEVTWFLAYSTAVLFVAFGRSRHGFIQCATAAALGSCIAAPWWLTALAHHGTGPFFAAGATSSTLASIWPRGVVVAYASAGLAQVVTRDIRLVMVGWLCIAFLFNTRSFPWLGVVPAALLVGALVDLLVTRRVPHRLAGPSPTPKFALHPGRGGKQKAGWVTVAVCTAALPIVLFYFAGFSGWNATQALSPVDRASMERAMELSAPSSRFLVVSGDRWAWDRAGEWFPLLAHRVSVATVQGTEWLTNQDFRETEKRHSDLQKCVQEESRCLSHWREETGTSFSYVYLPRRADDCCARLRNSLGEDPSYELVYDAPGATIFRVLSLDTRN